MSSLQEALKKISLMIFDIDGVFTDGKIISHADGTESKSFNVHDGAGIQFLHKAGIKTAVITGRESASVGKRASELGIEEVYQGISDKLQAYERIVSRYDVTAECVGYLGDDLPDLQVMGTVGLPMAVSNARIEVKERALYVTELEGGNGAVREAAELILKAQGQWDKIVESFS